MEDDDIGPEEPLPGNWIPKSQRKGRLGIGVGPGTAEKIDAEIEYESAQERKRQDARTRARIEEGGRS